MTIARSLWAANHILVICGGIPSGEPGYDFASGAGVAVISVLANGIIKLSVEPRVSFVSSLVRCSRSGMPVVFLDQGRRHLLQKAHLPTTRSRKNRRQGSVQFVDRSCPWVYWIRFSTSSCNLRRNWISLKRRFQLYLIHFGFGNIMEHYQIGFGCSMFVSQSGDIDLIRHRLIRPF